MSDPIDIASECEALALAAALTLRKPNGPQPTGRCHYCDSRVAQSLRWCDITCRDDWEAEQVAR